MSHQTTTCRRTRAVATTW